jgi:hypothetical protein
MIKPCLQSVSSLRLERFCAKLKGDQDMFTTHTTYLGIDPTAGQRPFAYVALDNDLNLLAVGQCSMEDVLAFVAGLRQAYVGVCAPRRPNQGVMEDPETRQSLSPQPRPGRWTNFRLLEYQFRQHNISCPQTPSKEEDCPNWMRMGFQLYQRLESMDYAAYPDQDSPRQYLEVYPYASYCALLGVTPFPKYTLEGRIQRQLVLYEQKLHVPDPMRYFEEITRHRLLQGIMPSENLYSPSELDALIAAYTAWMAAVQPESTMMLGDPQEGQAVLPVVALKRRY